MNGEVVPEFSDALLFDAQNPSVNEAVFHLSVSTCPKCILLARKYHFCEACKTL